MNLTSFTWDEWRGSLDGRPTMWIKRLAAWRGWCLDLHKFVATDDPGCWHTHPAYALRIVLWGGYVEDLQSQPPRTWWPGRFGIVPPGLSHRISSLINGRVSYSLWLRGPKCAEVEIRGGGWAQQASRPGKIVELDYERDLAVIRVGKGVAETLPICGLVSISADGAAVAPACTAGVASTSKASSETRNEGGK
jgi:hypothetical protein